MAENVAIGYLKQISIGFLELQKYEVMHRDMKPGNLFLKYNNCLVIGDFGLAKTGLDFAGSLLGKFFCYITDNIFY
jgi:serine/threonine protein kinase